MDSFDFAAQTAVGPTAIVSLVGNIKNNHTVEAKITGSPTVCTYRLEGSIDGSAWYPLGSTIAILTSNIWTVTSQPIRLIRCNLLTLTGAATIQFKWTGA